MNHRGGCHCGKITFGVDGDIDKAIECNCSICSKRAYLLWFVPRESLHMDVPEADLAEYTFNTHRIRHLFCPVCGVAPFAFGTAPDGRTMAGINVRCLEGVDSAGLAKVPFDGRSL